MLGRSTFLPCTNLGSIGQTKTNYIQRWDNAAEKETGQTDRQTDIEKICKSQKVRKRNRQI